MERTRKRPMKLAAVLLAVGLLGAACGGSAEEAADQARAPEMGGAETGAGTGTDTPAAQLVQGLTDLLDSHVFLAGIAVEQAVLTEDPESPQFTAAAGALDRNSQDLAAAIESVYGPEAGDQFLDLWRQHIEFFVQYTVGGITGEENAQMQAKARLDQYRQDFGAFIDSATGGELPAEDVAAALQEHVNSLLGTIDQVIAGDASAFDSLYDSAHQHMPGTATALANGIIAANPDLFGA
jgi:hypothetical protein